MTGTEYSLGHSAPEIRRLMHQAALLRPITERLLRGAGIGPGMRVLDLGCGSSDASMLAAELVGPSGSVVGIDRSRDFLAVAGERARTAELRHVDFQQVSAEAFSDPRPFDAVISRHALFHQADPVGFIPAAAGRVRPGGVLAFQDGWLHGRSLPGVSFWRQAGEWIWRAFQAVAPHFDVGGWLIEHFSRAGLPDPTVFCRSLVGDGEDSLEALEACRTRIRTGAGVPWSDISRGMHGENGGRSCCNSDERRMRAFWRR